MASKGDTGDQARSLLARWRQMLREGWETTERALRGLDVVIPRLFWARVLPGRYPHSKRHGRGALRISLVSRPLEVGLPLASVTALQPQRSWQAVPTGVALHCAPRCARQGKSGRGRAPEPVRLGPSL